MLTPSVRLGVSSEAFAAGTEVDDDLGALVAHATYVLLEQHGTDLDEAGVWVGRSLEDEEPGA